MKTLLTRSQLTSLVRSSALACWPLALLAALAIGVAAPEARAAIPEPYNLIYGSIEMDGHIVTSSETNVFVQARRLPTGATIATYQMGSQASASNFYALKIRLESPEPDDIMKAAETGTTLYITVLKGTIVKNQLEYDMGERGVVKRLDFGNIDTDGDGLPDGWEQAYLFGLQFGANDDPDHDGVSNRDEYALGTHPFRPDAHHPADVNLDWRISIPELSAYYSAWKKGNSWPIAPTNIPLEFVTRGTYIWEQGEVYHLNLDSYGNMVGNAPTNWLPGALPTNTLQTAGESFALVPAYGPTDGPRFDSTPSLPLEVLTYSRPSYRPGETLTITNRVSVRGSLRTYAMQQRPPVGWSIVAVEGGSVDPTNNFAKWGPYFDRASRDLVVTLIAPTNAHGLYVLAGAASYDGFRVPVQGVSTLVDSATLPSQIVFKPSAEPRRWVLQAPPLQAYAVEVSSDLQDWIPIATNWTDVQGQFMTPAVTERTTPVRFYRARLLP